MLSEFCIQETRVYIAISALYKQCNPILAIAASKKREYLSGELQKKK
jgi:hypothetical protein